MSRLEELKRPLPVRMASGRDRRMAVGGRRWSTLLLAFALLLVPRLSHAEMLIHAGGQVLTVTSTFNADLADYSGIGFVKVGGVDVGFSFSGLRIEDRINYYVLIEGELETDYVGSRVLPPGGTQTGTATLEHSRLRLDTDGLQIFGHVVWSQPGVEDISSDDAWLAFNHHIPNDGIYFTDDVSIDHDDLGLRQIIVADSYFLISSDFRFYGTLSGEGLHHGLTLQPRETSSTNYLQSVAGSLKPTNLGFTLGFSAATVDLTPEKSPGELPPEFRGIDFGTDFELSLPEELDEEGDVVGDAPSDPIAVTGSAQLTEAGLSLSIDTTDLDFDGTLYGFDAKFTGLELTIVDDVISDSSHLKGVATVPFAEGTSIEFEIPITSEGFGDPIWEIDEIVDLEGETGIQSFVFQLDKPLAATIDKKERTITALFPAGTDPQDLVVDFQVAGTSVVVGSTEQVSGVSTNDFRETVTYTVVGRDGSHVQYTVDAYVEAGCDGDGRTCLSVNPDDLEVHEGDAMLAEVSLQNRPKGKVVLDVALSDDSEIELSVSTIEFTPDTWSRVRVRLEALDNDLFDGNRELNLTFTVDDSATEDTLGYADLPRIAVPVTIIDDEVRGDFPAPGLVSPEDGAGDLGKKVTFSWTKGSTTDVVEHELFVCENEDFEGCEPRACEEEGRDLASPVPPPTTPSRHPLERQTVDRLSRPDQQLERRFWKHDERERTKNAPSSEVGGVFWPHHGGKLIGALAWLSCMALLAALALLQATRSPLRRFALVSGAAAALLGAACSSGSDKQTNSSEVETCTVTLEPGTEYFWKVRAIEQGESVDSEVRTLTP